MPLWKRLLAALRAHLPAALTIAALNAWICGRLFSVEYTTQFSSIEGAFIALPRYLSQHWGDFSWWPLWHCGMPYQDTYVPLLHVLVALVATWGGVSAIHAYHCVVGVTYLLGPVTLYVMAVKLGAGRWGAFFAAVFYSVLSPSVWMMPAIARDMGGLWFCRRLQVLTVYGEGPHISAMTLLPLVIAGLAHALQKQRGRAFALAALLLALLLLTNVPGTMGAGLAVFCWIVCQPPGSRRNAWITAAAATALAYAIACYGIPPSAELTVLGNVGSMHKGFSTALKLVPLLLALLLAATGGVGYLLSRTRVPPLARFALLYFALTAVLVLTATHDKFELLPQAGRLHLEMEMGPCLLLGALAGWLFSRIPSRSRAIVLVLPLALLYVQADQCRAHAEADMAPANLATRSEYTSARWADANLRGQRVYVTGSTSFWWNAFTDVPQVLGCCDQGQSLHVLAEMPYLVNPATGMAHELLTKAYLQALGAQAIVVNGEKSTDEYKDIRVPERFDAMLPVLHRELGDTIYGVPQLTHSLAHVVRPGEAVPTVIRPGYEPAEVVRYAAVIEDASRPAADFQWLRGGSARIRAPLTPSDLISVQVPWFSGWKAWVGGRRIAISSDGLGFQVLHPQCQGPCEISLQWTGRPDLIPAALLSLAALLVSLGLLWRDPPLLFHDVFHGVRQGPGHLA